MADAAWIMVCLVLVGTLVFLLVCWALFGEQKKRYSIKKGFWQSLWED